MTADEDLVQLLMFAFYRFNGTIPEQKMLLNLVQDWRKQAYGPEEERTDEYRTVAERYVSGG